MIAHHNENLTWVDELVQEVQRELESCIDKQPQQTVALQRERGELVKRRSGWSQSLGDPDVPNEVRSALQKDWAVAERRLQEIDRLLDQNSLQATREQLVVNRQGVLEQLKRLPNLLAANNPTMANVELSKHIDRIVCFPDGRVQLRTFKLGCMPEAAELLAELGEAASEGARLAGDQPVRSESVSKRSTRRRSRARIAQVDGDDQTDIDAAVEFATDTNRFAGHDEKWFFTDEFQVPEKQYWIDAHHREVKTKYAELERGSKTKPTLKQLAEHFCISAQWIRKALDVVVNEEGRIATDRRHRGGYTPPLTLEKKQEIVRLYQEGKDEKLIVLAIAVSRGSVTKALDEWDEIRGEKRPDGRRRRWDVKKATAKDGGPASK